MIARPQRNAGGLRARKWLGDKLGRVQKSLFGCAYLQGATTPLMVLVLATAAFAAVQTVTYSLCREELCQRLFHVALRHPFRLDLALEWSVGPGMGDAPKPVSKPASKEASEADMF